MGECGYLIALPNRFFALKGGVQTELPYNANVGFASWRASMTFCEYWCEYFEGRSSRMPSVRASSRVPITTR